MTTGKLTVGTRTQLAGAAAAMNSLASGAYVVLGTLTHSSSGKVPLDCKVELSATPGTVSGTVKQLSLFAQASLDGTNFGTGPTSGTTVTDESNLVQVGVLPLNTSATLQRQSFSLAQAFGGALPFATKLIVKNESGATLAASGHDLYTSDYSGDFT